MNVARDFNGAVSSFDRREALRRLAGETFDVLVIGGGITGAGCALDAATRGLRVALVEAHDFASGTSSKSSKLVHGGLRYLQNGELGLVYESLAERQILTHNAPHLVHMLPFLLPIFRDGGFIDRRLARGLGLAMWGYDLTGGIRYGKLHERLSKTEALARFPTLDATRLAYAYVYFDATADDARLTLAIVRTAAFHGAAVANYAPVHSLTHDQAGRVTGATVVADDATIAVRARVVINACGVWSDRVRALDRDAAEPLIRPAKGIHITVPRSLIRNEIAAVLPVPGDKRTVFVVPWGDFTYIGTTDTDHDGSLDDPRCSDDDVAYLLRTVNASLARPIGADDIVGAWAGLRPLVAATRRLGRTSDLSRRHLVHTAPSGLITVTGGKLTTYRRMAKHSIDPAIHLLGMRGHRCLTKKVPLVGAERLARGVADVHLAQRYGSEAGAVVALARQPELARPLIPGLPYLRAEVVFAARYEMAQTVDDVLSRRTRARILARAASIAAAPDVAMLLGEELGLSADAQQAQVAAYRTRVGDAE
ncbi:MAG TPA: glycerol-3-phosphate dehydrogenase/oxidase [Acidimicrobiales bacterium]|nr:glycerol-3-phosphate dehydrogenase/oxidase [Acidimicrobiales bacterium]